jgi:hypothetical protein
VGTTTLLSSTAVVELRLVAVADSGAGATVVPAVGGRVDEVSMEPPAEP